MGGAGGRQRREDRGRRLPPRVYGRLPEWGPLHRPRGLRMPRGVGGAQVSGQGVHPQTNRPQERKHRV